MSDEKRLEGIKQEHFVKKNFITAVFGGEQVEFLLTLIDEQAAEVERLKKEKLNLAKSNLDGTCELVEENQRLREQIAALTDSSEKSELGEPKVSVEGK